MFLQRVFNGSTVIYLVSKKEKSDQHIDEFLKMEFSTAKENGYKPIVMVSGSDDLAYNTEMLVTRNKEEAARNEAACMDIAI